MFSLSMAAQVLIWVVVGGLGTLLGPVAACFALQIAAAALGKLGFVDPNIVLGLVLIVFVVFVPGGIQPALAALLARISLPFSKSQGHMRREATR
jgi:ABC-type branched-subunit amino acid transport system permease subunit